MCIRDSTAVIIYQLYPQVRAHPAILAVAPVLIGRIGLSRGYLAAHWMSDVLVGWLLGVSWLAICMVAHQQVARQIRIRTQTPASLDAA